MTERKTTEYLVLPSSGGPLSQQIGQNRDNISSPNPPILNLHSDILWWIFWLNADMEDEAKEQEEIAAIDTLRYSSQVCSRWRQIILSFSSLWGQVINLSRLEHDDWRDEVLCRTGRSLLSVLWVYPDLKRLSEDVAAEILGRHWDRIRWLEIDFTTCEFLGDFNIVQFWNIFHRPSEVLATFRVFFDCVDQIPSPILSPSDFIVFNNLAPALRVYFAPNIKFNLDAPWLANIRFLALNGQVSAYDVIQAIPHMPFLEILADKTSNAMACTGDAVSSLPQITAPSIKEIILSSTSDLRPYMDFLAQIKPAAGCHLYFNHLSRDFDLETLSLANRVLYDYSRCCNVAKAIDLLLVLSPFSFNFEAQIPREGKFCFKVEFYRDIPRDIVEAFFAALPSVEFREVKALSLEISPRVLEPADSRIIRFILSVPSVETLTVTPNTLDFLLNLPSDILAPSFPLLYTVEISRLPGKELSTIEQFLTSRILIGRPVGVLYIPINRDFYTDLRSLEEYTGLKIILQGDGEEYQHTCGNGRKDALLIPPKYPSDLSSSESSSEGE
ncbi:hypothetical protein GALMADRAFT_132751 [Galerina marginata CBS 339.88]|uniref:F-box domain-containing protein n=1 Tax=Galerina marginata (strain CBS 339.88) TaxID=685588 RepID=A0A067TUY5_GALM3|nr:hypothetical protein GALMADRAFT_132751 [Galerina marginata CBS 339.88]